MQPDNATKRKDWFDLSVHMHHRRYGNESRLITAIANGYDVDDC